MSDLIGVTLNGTYFVKRQLGRGGMADVYEAWDASRSAPVAIKVLRGDREGEAEWRRAFLKEVDWLEQLNHPYIVRCFGMERSGRIQFLVMEWVDGGDLRQEIDRRRRPFSIGEAIQILSPVCSALSYTHRKDIYHCDIKPANILIARTGEIRLTDFSVARPGGGQVYSGGTPVYMAPEQITGGMISSRTDIYGLGITLYEMLSGGVLPFRGDSHESAGHGSTPRARVEWEQCYLPLPPIQRYNSAVAPRMARVVESALSKDPLHRFETVNDFNTELARAGQEGAGASTVRPDDLLTTRIGSEVPPPTIHSKTTRPLPPVLRPQSGRPNGGLLLGHTGHLSGEWIAVVGERFEIGRRESNQLVLPDPQISRRHATLIVGRRVYIQDEKSTAGTFLNGNRLEPETPVPVQDGDRIRIGVWEFEYHSQ